MAQVSARLPAFTPEPVGAARAECGAGMLAAMSPCCDSLVGDGRVSRRGYGSCDPLYHVRQASRFFVVARGSQSQVKPALYSTALLSVVLSMSSQKGRPTPLNGR